MVIQKAIFQNIICLTYLGGLALVTAGAGQFVLFRAKIRTQTFGEGIVFGTGIGFGAMGYGIFALAAFQSLKPSLVYFLLLLFAIVAVSGWITSYRLFGRRFDKTHFPKFPSSYLEICAFLLLASAFVVSLLMTLTPAIGNDALSYHLAVPKHYLTHNGFYFIPGNLFSNYPLHGEMMFLIGLVLHGGILAKGIHWLLALLTVVAIWQFIKLHIPETRFKFLSLLAFYTIPSVFVTSHMAYTDLVLTLYVFLSFHSYTNWFNKQHIGWLIICALFTGLAVATKYGGLMLPLLGCLGILYACRQLDVKYPRASCFLCIYIAVSLLIGCPFYIKNWVLTGNPFYPFFYKLFGGTGWDADLDRLHDLWLQSLGMGRGFLDYLLLPWNLSFRAHMHSIRFDGVLGPIFILTLPAMFGIRNIPIPLKISFVYCGFTFLFWAVSAQQIRYLIPILPFLAITIGYTLSWYRRKKAIFTALLLGVAISLGVNGYHIFLDFQKTKPLRYIAGHESKDGFLIRKLPSYRMFQYINTELPKDVKIFFIYMKNLGYYCERSYYSDSIFESYTIQRLLQISESPQDIYTHLKNRGFTHILYDYRFVLGNQSALTEKEKANFIAFQHQHLNLIKTERRIYFLYRLKDT